MKKAIQICLIALLSISASRLWAQKQFTGDEAADSAQSWRGDARDLWNKKNPSKQEVERGIKILNHVVHFLDSVPIKQLGEGSLYLKFRKSDITRDLVYAYMVNHQYDEALATLNVHFGEGTSGFISMMETDSLFSGLKSDPRFITAMNKYKARTALYSGTTLKTPYQSNLPDAEKIAGLSLLWTQARTNFVYFDHLTADWNKTYLDFIPQVTATKSTLEYYRVLQKFYTQLHDGHSNVYLPKEIASLVNSRPPVRTELIEDRVFITAVNNDSLQKEGIIPGLEILKIDNQPVKDYADTYIKPYQSSSTLQDMNVREFTYALLSGDVNKPVVLELSNRSGKIITKSIPRHGYPKVKPLPAMTYKEIGQIGYLTINNFEDDKIVKQFDSLYTEIEKTKGLIIDIRNNGGGNSGVGNHLLAWLTDKPFALFAYKNLRLDARYTEPLWADNGVAIENNNKKHFYSKPVVLLVNAATFSAAEDFAVAFDSMKRGKLIGQPTGGSTGQPINFNLPGGGSARVCGRRETYADGKEFIGVGVQPNIVINTSISDLYNGADSVLNKALEILK